jgi:uncharacterized membrane protein YcaP (DUF421 family)
MEDYLGILIRISVMYIYVLILLRLAGKRSIASLSSLDLVIGLLIGDLFDDVIWAEVPLSQGIVAFTTVILLHMLVAFAEYRSDWIYQLISAKETELVRNGKLKEEGLQRERLRRSTVLYELRLQGEDGPAEIQKASLEPSGSTSVLKREASRPAQRRDLPALKKLVK